LHRIELLMRLQALKAVPAGAACRSIWESGNRVNAFWASENRDAFIVLHSSRPGNRRGRR
jgi:hypothetical protein